jgi:hypothetical protein
MDGIGRPPFRFFSSYFQGVESYDIVSNNTRVVINANSLVRGRKGAEGLLEPGLLVSNQRFIHAKRFITIGIEANSVRTV